VARLSPALKQTTDKVQAQDLAVLFKTVGRGAALFENFDAIRKLPQADDEELYRADCATMKPGGMNSCWPIAATLIALAMGALPGQGAEAVLPPVPAAIGAAPPPLPLPPIPKSPIIYFRQLLEAPAGTRAELLSGKSPEHRRVLERNLAIYDKLPGRARIAPARAWAFSTQYHAALPPIVRNARRGACSIAGRWPTGSPGPRGDCSAGQGYEQLTRTLTPGGAGDVGGHAVQSNAVGGIRCPARAAAGAEAFNRFYGDRRRTGETMKDMAGNLSQPARADGRP
jgi:hypothetical protein